MSFQNLERLEGLRRPDLGDRAARLALLALHSVYDFEDESTEFFKKDRDAAKIGRSLQKLSFWVKPVDSASDEKPLFPREEGFKNGVLVGLWLAADLYQENSTAIKAMKKYAKGLYGTIERLEVPDPNDRVESFELRSQALLNLGWDGAEMFGDLNDFFDEISDAINPCDDSQPALLAGTGLGLLTAMEGFYAKEMRSMSRLADSIAASIH